MSKKESLGLKRIEALHYYVHDLERSRRFYTERLDFEEIAKSGEAMNERGRQRSLVFAAGDIRIVCSEPVGEGGRAHRWLEKHPMGVGTVVFEVEDAEHTLKVLESRGGTPITNVEWTEDEHGKLGTFSITTPFGGSTFRFVERKAYKGLYPGFEEHETPKGGKNRFGFAEFDHITSNFETMAPALLWMEHVMGFERYWGIEFHTVDVDPTKKTGSGLRSTVMWDPESGAKFANNEPLRPYFRRSQINLFHEDQRGDGIQHAALTVTDILGAVRGLRERDVRFMPTPGTYYDALPERIESSGILRIDEDIEVLRELEILIDGAEEHQYLLQIFLQEAAGFHDDREAGPFFYEVIQRKGDKGFGGGNFRALFESIERQQQAEGRI